MPILDPCQLLTLLVQWLNCSAQWSYVCMVYPVRSSQIVTLFSQVGFGRKFFELMGTKLRMSSAYHPQTEGQTEVLNRCLEQYLGAFVADKPSSWASFLCWAEYHYNTSHHLSLSTSLFPAIYGRPPPTIPAYTRGGTSIAAVEDLLLTHDEVLRNLRKHLLQFQHRMRHYADKERQEKHFQVGDLVLVKLNSYRQSMVAHRSNAKLSKRYFGPFPITAKMAASTPLSTSLSPSHSREVCRMQSLNC